MSEGVYFVQVVPNGPVKIGWARNVTRRLDMLQNGCPSELVVLGLRVGPRALERDLHDKFAEHRIRGEWFNPTAVILREAKAAGLPSGLVPRKKRSRKLLMDCKSAEAIWRDATLTKAGKLRAMVGWTERLAVQKFGPCVRKGLTPKQAHANGSKGGRPLKPRETSKEVAEKHWFDMRWKTDAEAMKHAPGWYPNLAWRHFGPSGRPRKGSRKRSARNSKRS